TGLPLTREQLVVPSDKQQVVTKSRTSWNAIADIGFD
ncbi:MAG: hypothetical protein RL486_1545, partial [Actinomycetota bacterium]